jgi:hypothetical protein
MMLSIYNLFRFFIYKAQLVVFPEKVLISSMIGFNFTIVSFSVFFVISECFSISNSLYFSQFFRLILLIVIILGSNFYFLKYKRHEIEILQQNATILELDLKHKILLLLYIIVTVLFPILINIYANHR